MIGDQINQMPVEKVAIIVLHSCFFGENFAINTAG